MGLKSGKQIAINISLTVSQSSRLSMITHALDNLTSSLLALDTFKLLTLTTLSN